MARDKGYGRHSKRKNIEASIMHDREHSDTVAVELAVEAHGIYSDQMDQNDLGTANSPSSTATLTPQQVSGQGEPAAAVKVTATQQDISFDDNIAANPFVVNLMDRLAALENSLSRKSAEVEALNAMKAGRVRDSEPQRTTTQVHAPQPTQATHVLHGGIEVRSVEDEDAREGPANGAQGDIQSTKGQRSPALNTSCVLRKRAKRT